MKCLWRAIKKRAERKTTGPTSQRFNHIGPQHTYVRLMTYDEPWRYIAIEGRTKEGVVCAYPMRAREAMQLLKDLFWTWWVKGTWCGLRDRLLLRATYRLLWDEGESA